LDHFKDIASDFTSNPLHLQMICDTEGVENLKKPDVISLYEQFISKKLKHGLLTCRQMQEDTYDFPRKLKRIYCILTECALAQVLDNKGMIIQLEADRNYINLSGVATVENNKSLEFVHLTFAEFLTAQLFIQMCFGPPPDKALRVVEVELDVCKLFQKGVSHQTMRFVEDLSGKYMDKEIKPDVLCSIKEAAKEVFEHICRAGMINLNSFLLGKVFDGEKVKEWILESHATSGNGMNLYFRACCTSPELANLLSEWCPMVHIDDIDGLVKCLAAYRNHQCIVNALNKVIDWKSKWPRANFFEKYIMYGFSTELYEFVFENCPDMDDDAFLQKLYSIYEYRMSILPILPIILRSGADLNCEKNEVRLAQIIFNATDGDVELLKFAIEVAKHFQVTEDVDSEESLLLRKNIGAKSPQDLHLDSSSDKGRGLYLQHILECACALIDTGYCRNRPSYSYSDNHKYKMMNQLGCITDEALRPIATKFKLYMMRDFRMSLERNLQLFHEEQKWISRDFKFRCGCTLVHHACDRHNLQLLKALDSNGFGLTSANKKGETPLHWSVRSPWTECTEFLLKRLLGIFYVSLDAKREDIVPRTPDEQLQIEEILIRDAKGRTPFNISCWSSIFTNNALLMLYNLLGPMVILGNEEFLARSDWEQLQVQRILIDSDNTGFSTLHGAARADNRTGFLEFMLKNILGRDFIAWTEQPTKRNLEKHKQIVQLLNPKHKKGVTPLLLKAIYSRGDYIMHRLLLLNLLGAYFVETDETTERPLHARTPEENEFVRAVLFGEDDEGRSAFYTIASSQFCEEYVKLLYTVNGSYLLKKPASFVWNV
jgi:hypothetical protein